MSDSKALHDNICYNIRGTNWIRGNQQSPWYYWVYSFDVYTGYQITDVKATANAAICELCCSIQSLWKSKYNCR